ncbi:hypothetical protein EVAR_8724_1 [Eumeta japonica]|uniref:Uncharacterized protein n=1 Tax=Eumeta variegata TaxID=151549 RepID=A0A4C1XN99_EUMVA|nr:hypothetical protein EVAR_8724_1 [Eumeta japonica]
MRERVEGREGDVATGNRMKIGIGRRIKLTFSSIKTINERVPLGPDTANRTTERNLLTGPATTPFQIDLRTVNDDGVGIESWTRNKIGNGIKIRTGVQTDCWTEFRIRRLTGIEIRSGTGTRIESGNDIGISGANVEFCGICRKHKHMRESLAS